MVYWECEQIFALRLVELAHSHNQPALFGQGKSSFRLPRSSRPGSLSCNIYLSIGINKSIFRYCVCEHCIQVHLLSSGRPRGLFIELLPDGANWLNIIAAISERAWNEAVFTCDCLEPFSILLLTLSAPVHYTWLFQLVV